MRLSTLIEELKSLGVDVDDGLERVMGDADLYEMMLGMFIDSVNSSAVTQEDFKESTQAEVTEKIHMLKGVTGNLAITPLFISYTEVLGLLRSNKIEEAKAHYLELLPVQEKVLDCIKRHKGM